MAIPKRMITRRQVIHSLVAVAVSSLLVGRRSLFADPMANGAATLANPQPVPEGPLVPASVTVADVPTGTIGPAFAGFSYEKAEISRLLFRNKDLVALFRLLGPSLLRIGGDSSDKMFWAPGGTGQKYPQIAPSDVDAFIAFVKAAGWQCLYGVNLAGSVDGKTSSPELAADEIAYAAQRLGPSLYGIEIGNEPDAYNKAGRQYDGKEWSLQKYEAIWNQYRDAVLARNPDVVVTGPAAGHLAVWTIPFTKDQTQSKISLLTDHYYAGRGHSAEKFTVTDLIAPDALLRSNLKLMRDAQEITGIPFRLAETNTFAGAVPGVSDAYAAALWCIDFLFDCAQGGAVGVNFHSSRLTAYSPILDDETKVLAVRPEFHAMLLFTLAGQGAVCQTKVAAGSLDVTAYTVKTAAGFSVLIVNKDLTKSLQATVRLPQAVASAELLGMNQLTEGAAGPSLSATAGVTIQGAAVGIDGSFSPGAPYTPAIGDGQVSCYVPPLSVVLIRTT